MAGNTFKTKSIGVYRFYARKGSVKSNEVSVTAKEVIKDPKNVTLSVEPATIAADGVAKAKFSIVCDDEIVDATIYNVADDTALESNEFTTAVAGVYGFYAIYDEQKSNVVEVIAEEVIVEEKPIALIASGTEIKADGIESITFTIMQDGEDVTNLSTFYVDGIEMNSNKFITTVPGIYTIHATKESQTSNEITVTATEVKGGYATVFAEGVTQSFGWYDVNKVKDGSYNGDINMCWAAAASNILQWWLDRYVAAGNIIPDGCPNGKGSATPYAYELAIMEAYHTYWNNERGGWVNCGISWFFEGKYPNISNGAYPYDNTGGYFKEDWDNVLSQLYNSWSDGYVGEINGWANWGAGAGLYGDDRLRRFSEIVAGVFDRGIAGFVVAQSANGSGIHHSVTLWGYEIDNSTGNVTKLFITDSDDSITWPRDQILHTYTVTGSDSGAIKLSGVKTYYPIALYPVSGYGSAGK